ncbi:MAG: NADP(H)-dependent aldo-keto reductase [Chromatiales bacterium]|nr:NADP(H)-dependent aldo-keto reductase [Chromatiales bacterium]
MQYRRLGRTDIEVSALCLGTMTFGQQNSEAEAHAQLDRALAAGINFIDTAELYPVPPRAETQGRTEQYISSWLASRSCRDKVTISSKVVGPAGRVNYYRDGTPRLDKANISAAVDASLQRLGTDVIDIYQPHWPERKTNYFGRLGYTVASHDEFIPIQETLQALADVIEAGKIRHIGVSNETPWGVAEYLRLAAAENLPRIVSIQNPYSLLNRSFEIGLAEFSHREDVGLLAYSPLGFGMLTGKYLHGLPENSRLALFDEYTRYSSPESKSATAAYVALARQHDLNPAQMALAYVTSRPFVTSNIIGATALEQLTTNIDSINLTLSDEVLTGIEAIHTRYPNPAP